MLSSQGIAQRSYKLNAEVLNQKIINFADSLYPTYKGNFKLVTIQESPLGYHFNLVQKYRGLDIFGTYLNLHLTFEGKLYDTQSNIFEGLAKYEPSNSSPDAVWVIVGDKLIEMGLASAFAFLQNIQ